MSDFLLESFMRNDLDIVFYSECVADTGGVKQTFLIHTCCLFEDNKFTKSSANSKQLKPHFLITVLTAEKGH